MIAVNPIGAKLARIAAIAPQVESGACHLPLGVPGIADVVEELAGATRHDDLCDAAQRCALAHLAGRARRDPYTYGGKTVSLRRPEQ